ncbi:MAG TPA: PQQ-dependent sugar dehydrogenase [Membranihabitans sp.]|nr:PQQ-dependent sugar dehydrogenase [Membranihabitans sp.]
MNFDRFKTLHFIYFCLIALLIGVTPIMAQDSLQFSPWGETHSQPTAMVPWGDDGFVIIQKAGQVETVDADGNHLDEVLDISNHIGSAEDEKGLLGVALHPSYPDSPYLYLNHTDEEDNTAVVRYVFHPDSTSIDTATRMVLLSVEQPYANHNGGCIIFGPDGYLYIGMGDGGSAGDPENRAQDLGTLLGKMLRIDVDSEDPYGIPEDNPFVDSMDVMEEIWSYGLRNPWRFSFDKETGDMWIGDVGQGDVEEISLELRDSVGGLNYGWRCYEGDQEYDTSEDCEGPFVDPIITRDHTTGDASITGGYRYRGPDTSLHNLYVFGDFISGNIYVAMLNDLDTPTVDTLMTMGNIANVASFAEDNDGNLYALSLGGQIYKLETGGDDAGSECDTLAAPELAILTNGDDSTSIETDSTYDQYVWYFSEESEDKEEFESVDTTEVHELMVTEPGNYYVVVTDTASGCELESEIINVTLTNSVSALEFFNLKVYPNPVSDVLRIQTEEVLSNAKIDVINSRGQIVRRVESQLPGTVSLNNLPSGMYFVKFLADKKYHVAKIFKE